MLHFFFESLISMVGFESLGLHACFENLLRFENLFEFQTGLASLCENLENLRLLAANSENLITEAAKETLEAGKKLGPDPEWVEARQSAFEKLKPVLMLLAGGGLLIWILLKRSGRYFGKKAQKRNYNQGIDREPRPTGKWDGIKKDRAAILSKEYVQLHETARDIKGQIDSKMILLQTLISQSKEQIEQLEKLLKEIEENK